ncbi:hypothetical protein GIS00_16170 [Nakamurella sp. YIM 132087]|uniref:EfeO-type cupredoxin-like domain-containing protein n=1 Tax=Nakamurella alba TaxID=2665158 RepID=A0A7K1FMS8_9ACTN|nr:hypothetical protein [Nakamurella alba]MTD15472.1 hypothetical protein [Nakamurella alba]
MMSPKRHALTAVAALCLALTAGCGSDSGGAGTTTPAPTSTSASVAPAGQGAPRVTDKADNAGISLTAGADAFTPAAVAIPVGGTVTIKVGDGAEHEIIVGTEAPFTLAAGDTKIFAFDSPGTFDIGDIRTKAQAVVTVG